MFSTLAVVDPTQHQRLKISTQPDPTQPMGQRNPWTTVRATNLQGVQI